MQPLPINAEASPTSPLEYAHEYARRGWHVFPCWWLADGVCACPKGAACGRDSGKHPLVARGFKDASTEPAQIDAWWKRWPLAHPAIATGAVSGLVVIDLDKKPNVNGVKSLQALGTPSRTLTVRTGGGGLHLYYQHPGGVVPSSSGKLGPGIDVRGDGGYVIAPPSGHLSGDRYAW